MLSILMSLLTGKTFKDLLIRPLEWIKVKTGSKQVDTIVQDVRKDWGLPPDPEPTATHPSPTDEPTSK